MKVFVVSLARSLDRRERIEEKLKQQGIRFEFFDAVDGSVGRFLHSEKSRPTITLRRKGYQLKTSEVACFASHYELWVRCIELDEPIVILEDNVDPVEGLKQVLEHTLPLTSNYDYIKLSATQKCAFIPIVPIDDTHMLGGYSAGTCGTTAYIVTPKAASKFVTHAQEFIEPVDDYMEKPWRHGVQVYSVSPDLFTRAEIASTIGGKRKDKSKMTLANKIYAELFRTYESILKFLYWKNKA
ncbi:MULTISPECIES: glycosyltransferase family 25 protein [Vibrio]|uniref:glycosyltransferase family 25 protein n=1 Tax=Vibrio TaxID=662 RepID=UPI000941295C|nr:MULTISPECIES: glycosyltransferase family 25 protein [Vibrio]MCQ9065887.1 glycosyltransferase family 25 protein [Vibrio diabolicus]MCS0355086.1 glycosyltransferase family 25 protein [Vibrio diabolicus]OKQ13595.1 glycosyltransferase [Vibrio antiquarius]BDR19536.1 lipooligosaccharide 5G8 epitope biosynthesis-associated protein [Vibrio sp. STUT-A16]